MLKAKSLIPVGDDYKEEIEFVPEKNEYRVYGNATNNKNKGLRRLSIDLSDNKHHMFIKSMERCIHIPDNIMEMSKVLIDNREVIKEVFEEILKQCAGGKVNFSISLAGKGEEEKQKIEYLFRKIDITTYGRYVEEDDTIEGHLRYWVKSYKFIEGQYLKLFVEEHLRNILDELAKEYNTDYEIYKDVKVEDEDRILRNIVDMAVIIKDKAYVIECCSGIRSTNWNELFEKGEAYGILPAELLLVDIYASDIQVEENENLYGYNMCNLRGEDFRDLREKFIKMIKESL